MGIRVRVGRYSVKDENELRKALIDCFDRQGIIWIENASGRNLTLTIMRKMRHIEFITPDRTRVYRYPGDLLFLSVISHGTFSADFLPTEAYDSYIFTVKSDEEVACAHIKNEIDIVVDKDAMEIVMGSLKIKYPDLELAGIMGKE